MSLFQSIFAGYRESEVTKRKQHDHKFEELDHFPMLFSSAYLNTLYYEAGTPEECDTLMAYMARHNCVDEGIESYDRIFWKTSNKMKRLLKEDK